LPFFLAFFANFFAVFQFVFFAKRAKIQLDRVKICAFSTHFCLTNLAKILCFIDVIYIATGAFFVFHRLFLQYEIWYEKAKKFVNFVDKSVKKTGIFI